MINMSNNYDFRYILCKSFCSFYIYPFDLNFSKRLLVHDPLPFRIFLTPGCCNSLIISSIFFALLLTGKVISLSPVICIFFHFCKIQINYWNFLTLIYLHISISVHPNKGCILICVIGIIKVTLIPKLWWLIFDVPFTCFISWTEYSLFCSRSLFISSNSCNNSFKIIFF